MRLHTECDPSARLPKVVGAADHTETPPVGNVALRRAWLAQILEDKVRLKVHELKDTEKGCGTVVDFVGGPSRGCVVGVQEEVHGEEAEEAIVVEAVLEDVGEGHGRAGETMHEHSLELTLCVVQNDHEGAKLLVERQLGVLAIDLLAERDQEDGHDNRSRVLNVKDRIPADLRAQIFVIECHD